jgi:hypothetical protein
MAAFCGCQIYESHSNGARKAKASAPTRFAPYSVHSVTTSEYEFIKKQKRIVNLLLSRPLLADASPWNITHTAAFVKLEFAHFSLFSLQTGKSKNPRVSPGAFEKRREEMKSTAALSLPLTVASYPPFMNRV